MPPLACSPGKQWVEEDVVGKTDLLQRKKTKFLDGENVRKPGQSKSSKHPHRRLSELEKGTTPGGAPGRGQDVMGRAQHTTLGVRGGTPEGQH